MKGGKKDKLKNVINTKDICKIHLECFTIVTNLYYLSKIGRCYNNFCIVNFALSSC